LTSNTLLEEKLKDQERQNRQKKKEVEDLRKAAADFEKQQKGFNEVLDHFQKTLLGNDGSPYFVVFDNVLCQFMTLCLFPPCSYSGASRCGFRHRLAYSNGRREEGATWPSQCWSSGMWQPGDSGFIQPYCHWADQEALARAWAGGGLEVDFRSGWC
jgi:hypothetical protein